MSSSSWGCELKCSRNWYCRLLGLSSSSWGCELKSVSGTSSRCTLCHPLREDVSWNTQNASGSETELVILFVRMWVEITSFVWGCRRETSSSSSWGCELKYKILGEGVCTLTVILFVRMWVEMTQRMQKVGNPSVILFVRMWVEILKNTVLIIVVAIWFFLWGGELKYLWSSFSASHEGVTIIHYLIWILNSIIEISEEIFTRVPRKNEQHLVVSLIFIWYLNAG